MKENKKINLFLDDFRYPDICLMYMYPKIGVEARMYVEEDWTIVRNYNEFKEAILKHAGNIEKVSFDHDLADEHYNQNSWGSTTYKEKTGFDCAKLLLEHYQSKNLKLPKIYVHSMNPVGTENIKNLF